MPVSDAFRTSYDAFESYPANLVYKKLYPSVLTTYHRRIADSSTKLFVDQDRDLVIFFRDYQEQNRS